MKASTRFGVALVVILLFSANGIAGKRSKAKKDTLFLKMGGAKVMKAVVTDCVNRAASDARIKHYFAPLTKDPKRMKSFKANFYAQLCEATRGSCTYKGKDMKTAHDGMGITSAHWDALVEDLMASFDKQKVKKIYKKKVMALLMPMKNDIIMPVPAPQVSQPANEPVPEAPADREVTSGDAMPSGDEPSLPPSQE